MEYPQNPRTNSIGTNAHMEYQQKVRTTVHMDLTKLFENVRNVKATMLDSFDDIAFLLLHHKRGIKVKSDDTIGLT